MRHNIIIRIGLSLLLALLLVFSACTKAPATTSPATTSDATSSSVNSLATTTTAAQPLSTITQVVAKVEPSVVIINDQISTTNAFNQTTQAAAAGSGWIIRTDGYIVTNAHVVAGATNIVITLTDGRTLPAEKVYTDTITDLAIVKVNATNLPALIVGDSSTLHIGDGAIAIGNALGQGTSATAGIVSALHISISPAPGQLMHDLIQTDAAINPGNSGGPLVDMSAQVIGISSYKVSQVGVEGMGYAISINEAIPILNTLISTGFIVRPYLGTSVFTVDQTVASY
jgi:serine protease Do